MIDASALKQIRTKFGSRLQENVPMSGFTSVRIGGPADALLIANTAADLEEFATFLWDLQVPFLLLGGGSNVLVSDKGIRGMVVINRTSEIRIEAQSEPPTAWAESGVSLVSLARKTAEMGLSGLEWSAPIPGSVGGALYGNAGAHGGEICRVFALAEILHPMEGKLSWNYDQMKFAYRTTGLKQGESGAIILAARFKLERSTSEEVLAKMKEFADRRRAHQPAGFSIGSTFRNPAGDKAGRLIEAAGLKGHRLGGAVISDMHANFVMNDSNATAADYFGLVKHAKSVVKSKFGVDLHPEIELIGEWDESARSVVDLKTGKIG